MRFLEDNDAPMPDALHEGFRFQRFGAPYSGGYRQWPYRWFKRVETALNVYEAMKSVKWHMANLKDNALARWQAENARLINYTLWIESLVAEQEQAEQENG